MASNADWRGSTQEWETRVGGWLGRARARDLLNVDIFFDLVAVAGDARLATRLHTEAVDAAAGAPQFLALLATAAHDFLPLLGYFNRLRVDGGRVDLKRRCLLPVVSIARALALRIGSKALATPERLRDAAAAGRLSQTDAALMVELHAQAMTVILGQQLRDLDAGVRPSGRAELKSMRRGEARALAAQLRRLEQIMQELDVAMAR